MGQKVHPTIFRTGVIYSWPSRWFASGDMYADRIRQDVLLRKHITWMGNAIDVYGFNTRQFCRK